MTEQISLSVNDVPIELDNFVRRFINNTLGGMLLALRDTGEIKSLDLSIEGDKVILDLNNTRVPVNRFATKIIRSTVAGIVSPLKGVSQPDKINITIRR